MAHCNNITCSPERKEVKRMLSNRKGFTLIELLVVIAIIAILAAILFPVFAEARRKALGIQCLSNFKQIAMASMMYTEDWYGVVCPATMVDKFGVSAGGPSEAPDGTSSENLRWWWPLLCLPYMMSEQLYACPMQAGSPLSKGEDYETPGDWEWAYYAPHHKTVNGNIVAQIYIWPPGSGIVNVDTPGAGTSRLWMEKTQMRGGIKCPSETILYEEYHQESCPQWGYGPVNFPDGPACCGSVHNNKANVCWVDGHASSFQFQPCGTFPWGQQWDFDVSWMFTPTCDDNPEPDYWGRDPTRL